MKDMNDAVNWSTIFRIVSIVSLISTGIWWASSVDQKLATLIQLNSAVNPVVQRHETDIALIKQFVGIK